jgi:hypothetical protein
VTRVLAKQYDLLRTQIQIDLIDPDFISDDGLTLSWPEDFKRVAMLMLCQYG